MHLVFKQPATFTELRPFFAEVVRLIDPAATGAWRLESTTPLPHHFLGSPPELARTTWRLGEASLVEAMEGDPSGNPRDGFGYHLALALTVPGAGGVARRLTLRDASWDPHPKELVFLLEGFTAAEFLAARAAGRARFRADATAQVSWAAQTAERLEALGAREAARALVEEALSLADPSWRRAGLRRLLRQRVELTDEPGARAEAESAALAGDPLALEELGRVARGEKVLPGWHPSAARRVSAMLRPWERDACAELGGVATVWREHPWWPGGGVLEGWQVVEVQPRRPRREGNQWVSEPVGDYRAPPAAQGREWVRQALALGDVSPTPSQDAVRRDAVLLTHAGEDPCLRAVVEWTQGLFTWTWLWTGEGLEGAVLVARAGSDDAPAELHLAWLVGPVDAARLELALETASPSLRLRPLSEG